MNWNTMIECQIQKAKTEGLLDGLKGEGRPLSGHSGGDIVSAGYGMMAQAGVLPKEIVLKKAIEAQQLVLQETNQPGARKAEMRKLADLQMRLVIEQEARRKFYRST